MKAFKVKLLKAAQEELHEAFLYYSKIEPDLGRKFISCMAEAMNSLEINPFYAIRYGSFRLKIVPRFPYLLHFIVDEKQQIVKVIGIRSMYLRPKRYKNR